MSYGKPIISTYPSDGDAAQKYVSHYPEGLCLDVRQDKDINIASLNASLSRIHVLGDFDKVKSMFKDNTPECFLEVVDKTI